MTAGRAADLLEAWEAGWDASPLERAATSIAASGEPSCQPPSELALAV